jgi:starch-binding outer membrane protein, SusD/RagB family
MKKRLNYIIAIALLLLAVTSCKDVLDQKAVDSFNQEAVFSDVGMAKAFLGICYDRIGGDGGSPLGMREDMLASNTDEALCIHRPAEFTFVKGTLTPDNMGNFGSWRFSFLRWVNLYPNIQNTNTFLANVDKVPTKTAADAALITRMKGEAYFIRAYDYTQILMGTGGAVLSSSPYLLGQDYLTVTRSSMQETKDFILADIAQAISLLGTTTMEQGRATPGACAALKSRLLTFCASPLVNGGYEATNPLVSFTTGSQATRLTEARDAAKAIMDGTYGNFDLVGTYSDPPSPLSDADVQAYSDNYFNIFNQKSGSWNKETIWGIQYLVTGGNTQNRNIWSGPNGYHNWGNNDPLEPFVREYEMADGTPFVWGAADTRVATAAELAANSLKNPYNGREPRFYATILYDGAKWQARPTDMAGADPLGIVQTGHWYKADGVTILTPGLDTRQATVENWNGGKNGYYMKKFMDPSSQGQYFNNTNSWIEFRFAEVLLNYAEACIELGGADLQNGIAALNKVRNRAGLPDRVTSDQAQARTWLRHERALELYGEDRRWYDIRRWMIAPNVITNVRQMLIKKFIDGSRSWQVDMSTVIDDRVFKPAAYWIPIPRDEMNKAPQLVQNPGYN